MFILFVIALVYVNNR